MVSTRWAAEEVLLVILMVEPVVLVEGVMEDMHLRVLDQTEDLEQMDRGLMEEMELVQQRVPIIMWLVLVEVLELRLQMQRAVLAKLEE